MNVPHLVSSLDRRLNSTGELGDTPEAGRYQFFLQQQRNRAVEQQKNKPRAARLQPWPAEELHRQEPRVTAEGSVLPAAGPNAVVDLGDVWSYVLDACEVKAVYPETGVDALHLALKIVEGPCCVLQERWAALSWITFM